MHFQVKMTFWGNKEPFLLFDLMKYEMYQSSSFFCETRQMTLK